MMNHEHEKIVHRIHQLCNTIERLGAELQKAGEEVEQLRTALLNIRDTVESCYVAGEWVPLDEEEMAAISDIANAALGPPND